MDCQKNDDDDSPFQLNMDTLQASIFRLEKRSQHQDSADLYYFKFLFLMMEIDGEKLSSVLIKI